MIKIDWQRLLIERGFCGFYGWIDPTAEPGNDFVWSWGLIPWNVKND
jgi:hypothetical protein